MTRRLTTQGASPHRPAVRGAAPGPRRSAARPADWVDPLAPRNPLVNPRWLLGALALTVAAAAICGYLTLCLLFYQGQWQIVFQPSATITATPASRGLRFDEVRFDTSEAGIPQLAGWWIPAETGAQYASSTILFIHDGRGNMSESIPQIVPLHSLGINVFMFDFRGYGHSEQRHPSEARVYEDADAAIRYLTDTRHIAARQIVIDGIGLGATIGAEAALRHPDIPALVIENPKPPALSLIEDDPRTRILPVRLLFRDRFDLLPRVKALGFQPDAMGGELFAGRRVAAAMVALQYNPHDANGRSLLGLFDHEAPSADPHYSQTLKRFLDDVLPAAPPQVAAQPKAEGRP